MLDYVKSQWLKQRRSFLKSLLWIGPLLTLLLASFLVGGENLQNGAYNWWYLILLPGCFTMFSAFTAARERKKNRRGLLAIAVQKKKLWLAQIILGTLFLFALCASFLLMTTLFGLLFGQTVALSSSLLASVLLFLTFAWQIPFWMFLTEQVGAIAVFLLSFLCNFGVSALTAVESCWWIPFSIPARLMCSAISVLPNGLWAEEGSDLTDSSVIVPGVLIIIALYLLLTAATSLWFERREV